MAKEEKPKNKPQMTDKAQSERFHKTARQLECNESEEAFVRTFKKIVPPKRPPSDEGNSRQRSFG